VNLNGELLTIPSRNLEVWRRMYDRYSLEPRPATVVPDVSKTIVPTTDADALLVENGTRRVSTAFGAAIATFETVFTVPAATRLHVNVITLLRTVGDNDWDQVQLRDASQNFAMAIDFTAAQSAQVFLLGNELILEATDEVRVLFGGTGVAATTVQCAIWSGIEAAF